MNRRPIAMMFIRPSVYGWIVQVSGHPDTKACIVHLLPAVSL